MGGGIIDVNRIIEQRKNFLIALGDEIHAHTSFRQRSNVIVFLLIVSFGACLSQSRWRMS